MKKSEFIGLLAKDLSWSKAKTERTFVEFFRLITDIIIQDGRLVLPKFGIFSIRHRSSRRGRNPRTGEELIIPPKEYIHFKASKSLLDSINK
jgi:nucleoid DNA-binding protein